MVISVQMVWRNVGYYRYIRLEIIYIVQLETAELQNIDVEFFSSDLVGVAFA